MVLYAIFWLYFGIGELLKVYFGVYTQVFRPTE